MGTLFGTVTKVPLGIITFVIGFINFKYLFRWYVKWSKRDHVFMVQNIDTSPGTKVEED